MVFAQATAFFSRFTRARPVARALVNSALQKWRGRRHARRNSECKEAEFLGPEFLVGRWRVHSAAAARTSRRPLCSLARRAGSMGDVPRALCRASSEQRHSTQLLHFYSAIRKAGVARFSAAEQPFAAQN